MRGAPPFPPAPPPPPELTPPRPPAPLKGHPSTCRRRHAPRQMDPRKRQAASLPVPTRNSHSTPLHSGESPPLLLSESSPLLLSESPPLLLSESPPLLLSESPPLLSSESPRQAAPDSGPPRCTARRGHHDTGPRDRRPPRHVTDSTTRDSLSAVTLPAPFNSAAAAAGGLSGVTALE